MNPFKLGWAVAGLTVALPLLMAGSAAGADSITISNASFEIPVQADGGYTDVGYMPGWSGLGDFYAGVWNPEAADYTGDVPDGSQVGYIYINATYPNSGLYQVLTNTLAADKMYTLTMQVGNTLSYNFAGYQVQLRAGETVLAQDDNSKTITDGTFTNVTVTYVYSPAQSDLVGQPLEIRLLPKEYPGSGSYDVEFDDVRLTATSGLTPPVLSGYGPLSGTSFPLTFSGPSGQSYQVLSSTNVALPLASWSVLDSGTFGASPVNYTNTSATNALEFYRIQSP